MSRLVLTWLVLLAGTAFPLTAQPIPASVAVNPHAIALFDRDAILMNWALRSYDKDGDVQLSLAEAQAAADAFKAIADTDHDGRVTPQEYRAARDFIIARF